MARKTSLPFPPDDDKDGRDDEQSEDTSINPADFEQSATPPEPPNVPPPVRDPFDPAFLGLSQDFAGEAHVAKKWDIIKVEKPTKSRVFRVHPTMRLKTMLLTLKEDNETYLVLPQLRPALANESLCGLYTLLACVTKPGTPFLWPVRMADPDGKWNIWHKSAWEIGEKAQTCWARMEANKDAGYYVAHYDRRPLDQQHEPPWPDMPFRDWLELAFKGFTIDSLDHPVLKRLRLED